MLKNIFHTLPGFEPVTTQKWGEYFTNVLQTTSKDYIYE